MVGKPFVDHSANYLIDVDNVIILDIEATAAGPAGRGRGC
jgi:hypothetical protein